jgi:Domain of unknown function (DUF929)
MVDWEAVERLRAKGWDWARIAEDEKVGFHADSASGDPGRALRALYYQRRSKQQRRPASGSEGGKSSRTKDSDPAPKWTLLRVGWILVPAVAVWFVLALVFPSPVGVYLSAIPDVGLILAVVAFLLIFALLRTDDKWNRAYRNTVVVGAVLGLVIAGGFGLAAILQGCPTLSATGTQEPSNGAVGSWVKYTTDARWTQNGLPTFFFYGSIGCPYCSASSWAFYWALEKFGTVQGLQYGHSNPNDVDASTPELEFVSATFISQYVSLHILEADDDSSEVPPAPSECVEQAYVSSYDSTAGIPFVVVGGQYVHTDTIVDPASLQPLGLSPQTVLGQVLNESGAAWDVIAPNAYMLAAIMLKATGGQPASLLADSSSSVAADYRTLS